MGMLIIYSAHVCVYVLEDRLVREGGGSLWGKGLAEMPCGRVGKPVAIEWIM